MKPLVPLVRPSVTRVGGAPGPTEAPSSPTTTAPGRATPTVASSSTSSAVGAPDSHAETRRAVHTAIGVDSAFAGRPVDGGPRAALRGASLGARLLVQSAQRLVRAVAVGLVGVALLAGPARADQPPVETSAAASTSTATTSATTGQSATATRIALLQRSTVEPGAPLVLGAAHRVQHNSAEATFQVPSDQQQIRDGQSVLVPLEAGRTLHMIELRYQDTRPLRDLEFNRRVGNGAWETFRGDEYHATVEREKAGEVVVKRESDHNAAWINNPVRVRVDVVDQDGKVLHAVGKKFVDFHTHDAWSAESSGSAETDNISNSYESLPQGLLPAGAQLRLTPVHENRRPWEQDRLVAMDLHWVKPIYLPEHSARAVVRTGDYEAPNAQGYTVDKDRPIAALFVKWTDHGGSSSGRVRLTLPDGTETRSASYNVGSGETELIPLDGLVSRDGKIFIEGYGLFVGDIQVLYR
jgi:hypothetical protein